MVMNAQASVRPAFATDLDSQQRAKVWEYNKELKQLGFPTKLRRELVEEYSAMLRAEHDTWAPSITR